MVAEALLAMDCDTNESIEATSTLIWAIDNFFSLSSDNLLPITQCMLLDLAVVPSKVYEPFGMRY